MKQIILVSAFAVTSVEMNVKPVAKKMTVLEDFAQCVTKKMKIIIFVSK